MSLCSAIHVIDAIDPNNKVRQSPNLSTGSIEVNLFFDESREHTTSSKTRVNRPY